MEAQNGRGLRVLRPAKGLDETRVPVGGVELPGHPISFRQAVRRERIEVTEHQIGHLAPLVGQPAIERPIQAAFPDIDRHAEGGAEVAAHRIDILLRVVIDTLAIIWNPGGQTVSVTLITQGKGGVTLE